MTLKERIQAYCQYKGISVSQFERQAGLSNGYFKEGSKMPRPDRISKIQTNFLISIETGSYTKKSPCSKLPTNLSAKEAKTSRQRKLN